MASLTACQADPHQAQTPTPTWRDLYDQLKTEHRPVSHEEAPEKRLTLSAENMPLAYFLRWISDQAGISIVAADELDARPVTLDVVDVPVSQLLSSVARRLGVSITRTGRLYYVGELRPEDRGVLVRKVVRLKADELTDAVSSLTSEHGRFVAFSDGLLLVGDRVEVLEKIEEMLAGIEAAPLDSWLLQLYIVSMTSSRARELGFDVEPAIDIAATVATASEGAASSGYSAAAELLASLRVAISSNAVELVASPMFVLVDGGESRFKNGTSFPVPKRATSPEGTTRTEAYEYIDVGLSLDVNIRDLGGGRAITGLDINLTQIAGTNAEAPIIVGQAFATTAVMESGGVYLLGEIAQERATRSRSGGLGLVYGRGDEQGLIQVWAKAHRIKGTAHAR